MNCSVCPRNCKSRENGICGVKDKIIVSRIAPHFWEEPIISGQKGSGTVFFAGCSLRCVFCQNKIISKDLIGKEISEEELDERIKKLINKGVHNINFVSPSHYADFLATFLEDKDYSVPVVYNTGGYDSVQSLENLRNKVQIYLPDMKYRNSQISLKYSGTENYPEVAEKAIEKMYDLVGDCEYDENELLKRGVIVRHLMLPDNLENTLDVIDWFEKFSRGKKVLFSLMSQYTPYGNLENFPELNRKIFKEEYEKALNYASLCAVNGFMQDYESSSKEYIPHFSAELDEE